jgi:nitrous oxidase accessory protein
MEETMEKELTNDEMIEAFEAVIQEANAGNAIHVWRGENIHIEKNTLSKHRDGIYFEFVDNSMIRDNTSVDNLRYGLHFMFSNHDRYENNIFRNNGSGVAVMFSDHIQMKKNQFLDNMGGASYGLLLKEISDGEISHNKFSNNTIALLAEGTNRLEISRNEFLFNGTALDIKGNSLDNVFEKNNFLANSFDVVTNTRYNRNSYHLNFWSRYSGYDLDRDGVGDQPYRPVSLFAKIIDEIPSASILLHSSITNLLEITEGIIPEIIPDKLRDDRPKMTAYEYNFN